MTKKEESEKVSVFYLQYVWLSCQFIYKKRNCAWKSDSADITKRNYGLHPLNQQIDLKLHSR